MTKHFREIHNIYINKKGNIELNAENDFKLQKVTNTYSKKQQVKQVEQVEQVEQVQQVPQVQQVQKVQQSQKLQQVEQVELVQQVQQLQQMEQDLSKPNSSLSCKKCKITFDNKSNWNEHMVNHSKEKLLKSTHKSSCSPDLYCKLCKMDFPTKSAWGEHILKHAKEKVMKHFLKVEKSMPQVPPFSCIQCDYIGKSKQDLR